MTSVDSVTSMDHVERLRRPGVVWWSYLSAGRHLMRLALPGVMVHVPLAILSVLGLALGATVSGSGAVVNGQLQLIGMSDVPLLISTAALMVIGIAGETLVFPATVILAAGHLVGRRVSPVEALRATVGRLRTLLALLAMAVPAYAAAVAAAGGVLLATEWEWAAYLLLVVLALVALPALLAVPGVMLHGCSALGAIGRAYRLIHWREQSSAFALAFGVVVFPAAALWGLRWGLSLLPDPLGTLGWGLGFVVLLALTPFQASMVAGQFLHCMAWRTEVDDTDMTHGLPGERPFPVRPALLWATLLPGLLSSGIVLVNPLGWTEVAETNVTKSWQTADTSSDNGEPELRPYDLRELHAGRGAGLVMVIDGFENYSALLACADPSCEKTTFKWAEPQDAGTDGRPPAVGARLPDGRLLLTTWRTSKQLELLTCEADKCVPSSGPIAKSARFTPQWAGVALAVRQGGGVVVAFAEADVSGGQKSPTHDLVSFVFCADTACARPDTRQVARLDATAYLYGPHGLAVAVGPGDRPVAARYDSTNGQIHVISCLDAACHQPRVTRPVPPAPGPYDLGRHDTGLSLAVRPDGRPVIAYLDGGGHSVKLLDCRTPDCAQFDALTLGAGTDSHATPALALDRKGRPLVAFESPDLRRLMLAHCTGNRCVSTPVSRIEVAWGDVIAMTVNSQGRPAIAWFDGEDKLFGGEWHLNVTTPLNLVTD
jgi:hypothetical protein